MDQVGSGLHPERASIDPVNAEDHFNERSALQRMKKSAVYRRKAPKSRLSDNHGISETRQQVLRWLAEKGFSQD